MVYKISIILPIFNVEKYLRNALDSIINQTFGIDNLEVIMVDDCSTDSCGEIIDEYHENYDNFIAIHLDENSGGAGIPRNIGLNNVSSDYVMFLDPDDEFMPDICEVLYNKLFETNSDIVTGNAINIQDDFERVDLNYSKSYFEIIPNKNLDLFKPFRMWGTLFNYNLINENNIRCIDVATNEDTYFNYECFFNANKIVYLKDYLGVKHYDRNECEHISLTHDLSKERIISTIEAFKRILLLISNSNPTKDYTYDPFILNIFVRFNYKWDMDKKDKIEIFEKILEYESISYYLMILPFHFKVMNFLLNKKWFNCLILIQIIFSRLIQSKFIKSRLSKRIVYVDN